MPDKLITIDDDKFPEITVLDADSWVVVGLPNGKTAKISRDNLKAFLGTVQTIVPKAISIADPAPVIPGIYRPTASGTYANLGGLVIDTNGKLNEVLFDGVIFANIVSILPAAVNKIPEWEAKDYADQVPVNYNGQIYNLVNPATAVDIPGIAPETIWKPVIDKISESDLQIEAAGKNLLNPIKVLNSTYIDPVTAEIKTEQANYIATEPIILPSGVTLISVSGLSNSHHGLGWRINDINGDILKRSASSNDVTSFTVTTNGITGVPYSFQTTIKTNRVGDTTNPDSVQIEIGSASGFEPYSGVIDKIAGTSLTVKNVSTNPLLDKSPVNVGYFKEVAIKVADLSVEVIGKNLFDPNQVLINGFIDITTGEYKPDPTGSYKYSQPIPIDPSFLSISGLGTIHHGLGWRFNKADGSVALRGLSSTNVISFTANGSSLLDVVSFQFTVKTNREGDNTDANNIQVEIGPQTSFEPYVVGINKIKGYGLNAKPNSAISVPTKGKKIVFLGDSIATEATGSGFPVTNWPLFARPILEIETYWNYAFSGASFIDWNYSDHIRQQLSAQIEQALLEGVDPDIIVISIGTNDYGRLGVLGDYDIAMNKATLLDLDRTKILEAARWAFWTCRLKFPNARCFYGNPLQRAITSNSSESDDQGNWLRQPIERMARRYGFTVIDAFGKSGIVKEFEVQGAAGRYLADGLHPHDLGKLVQGRFYANEIIKGYIKQM